MNKKQNYQEYQVCFNAKCHFWNQFKLSIFKKYFIIVITQNFYFSYIKMFYSFFTLPFESLRSVSFVIEK